MSFFKNKVSSLLILFSFVGCASYGEKKDFDLCAFENKPVVIQEKGETLFQYWEFKAGALNNKKKFINLEYLNSYQRRIKNKVTDLRQEALRDRFYSLEKPGDQKNMRVVRPLLSTVRKINCQEALLVNLQGSRIDIVKKPTEFIAFEFHRNNKKKDSLLYIKL